MLWTRSKTVFVKWFRTKRDKELVKHSSVNFSQPKHSSVHFSQPSKYTRTQREHSMHPVCSVLTLLLPSKHCHKINIAQVNSLLPRGNSNITAQCLKSNIFNSFASKSASCFLPSTCSILMSSLRYLPHTEVSHLNVFRPSVILWVLG